MLIPELLEKTEEYQRFKETVDTVKAKMKPNPNNYPIVDKWNYKYVWKPHLNKIFHLTEDVMNATLPAVTKYEMGKFATVQEIGF